MTTSASPGRPTCRAYEDTYSFDLEGQTNILLRARRYVLPCAAIDDVPVMEPLPSRFEWQ